MLYHITFRLPFCSCDFTNGCIEAIVLMTFILLAVNGLLEEGEGSPLRQLYPYTYNIAEFASDVCAVIENWCDRKHSNGVACRFGQAVARLALLFLQQVSILMPMSFQTYLRVFIFSIFHLKIPL